MKNIPLLFCALTASAAYSAQLNMALFDEEDQNKDGYVDRVEAKGSVDLQARFKDIDPIATAN